MTNFTTLIWAGYYVYMLGKYGQTFGKKFLKIKVVTIDNAPLTYKIAGYRLLATGLSTLTLFLGFLMPLVHKKGMALHDWIVGTLVVDSETVIVKPVIE